MAKKQKIIVGIDEVGRGPLAGPVMACAFAMPRPIPLFTFCPTPPPKVEEWGGDSGRWLKDSKKTNPKRREEVYELLKKHPDVQWGIGRVSERIIDRVNIFQATKLVMIKAVLDLEKKLGRKVDLLLIDGNFGIDIARKQKSIIKGDEKVFLISLASIVAKVERDRLMVRLHKKYPQYGFDQHKGYGTKLHIEMIAQYGPCSLHRRSFGPIKLFT